MEAEKTEKSGDYSTTVRVSVGSGFLAFYLAWMVISAGNAADGLVYFEWAKYFATSDLEIFAAFPRSITGVPFVQWSYGSGMLSAILAKLIAFPGALPISVVSVFLGVTSTALVIYIALQKTGSLFKSVMVLAAITLFTPVGFYFNKYSVEGWTILLVLSALALIEFDRKNKVPAVNIVIMLGVCIYFLLLVKVQNVFLGFGIWTIYIAHAFPRFNHGKQRVRLTWVYTLLIAVPVAIALGFIFSYNHTVNGDLLKSPYDVGDEEFSMFSPLNIKYFEVLFSTWNGLFIYHPVIVIALLYLVRELFLNNTSTTKLQKLIIAGCCITFFAQLFVQGSWFIWWMGTGTFGARGFCGVALLMAYALAECGSLKSLALNRNTVFVMVLMCIFGAYILSLHETNMVNHEKFMQLLGSSKSVYALILIFAGLIIAYIVGMMRKSGTSARMSHVLLLLALIPAVNRTFMDASAARLLFAMIIALCVILIFGSDMGARLRAVVRHARTALVVLFTIVFSFSLMLQIGLLNDLNQIAKTSTSYGNSLDCGEFMASYNEYQQVEGYDREKEQLLAFLQRQGC